MVAIKENKFILTTKALKVGRIRLTPRITSHHFSISIMLFFLLRFSRCIGVNHSKLKDIQYYFLKLIFIGIQLFLQYCAKSLQSCPNLSNPMGGSPPGSSVQGILQARILEWVAMPFSRNLPNPGIEPVSLMSSAFGK